MKDLNPAFDVLKRINRDIIGEISRPESYLKEIFSVLSRGVWLSFSVRNDEAKKIEGYETCYDGSRKLGGWVFSKSFISSGFNEPMNSLLFSGNNSKCVLIMTRDGELVLINSGSEIRVRFVDGDLKTVNGEIDNEIKGIIKAVSSKTDDELYENISKAIKKLVENTSKKVEKKCGCLEVLEEKAKIKLSGSKEDIYKILFESWIWNRITDDYFNPDRVWQSIYYIPDKLSDSYYASGFVCATSMAIAEESIQKEAWDDISFLSIVCNRICGTYYYNWHILNLKNANTKSAIGSIMSRNGSHNIGSHVLAALSHNVGTLPDDRVLYQYIQQRMDYIATVTTDFPTWTQPTMFVADMMKTFLSQRHLLDHIVESEGLHAFQFQNPNMTDEEWEAQENCVKIHVRKVDGNEKKDFIKYEKDKREAEINLTNDVALAIPGGIIGEHAFYTILENIIRNAAKHSWSTIKQRQISENEIELKYNNLDLFIDFEEKDDEVKFNVYAKLPMAQVVVEKSKADDKLCQKVIASEQLTKWKEKFDDVGVVKAMEENEFKELPDYEQEQVKLHLTNLKDDPLKKWVDRYDKQGGLTSDEQKEFDSLAIHHKQQVMLARPFIDSQGALRRENWGMAEMKISAGYLAGESIEAIGGIGDKKGSNEIITPRIKSKKVKRKCLESGEKVTEIEVEELYLGYEFSIAKPKEILIIVAEELNREGNDDGWGRENIRNELKNHGIFVKTVGEIKQEKRLNYRYVVHYNARELFDKNYHVKDDVLLPFRMLSGADIEDERLKRFIPTIQIDELKKCFGENAKASKNEIQKLVYNAYLKHLLGQIGIAEQRIGLLVSINENEKAGGNSLISDADILELMLEQNFAVCVDQYKAFAANEDNRKIIKCLESIRHRSSAKDKVIKFKHLSNKTIRELIAQRMCDWAGKSNDSWIPIVEHLRKKYFVSDAKSETSNELKLSNNEISVDFAESVNSLLQKHPIDDFIRYVESIFENTKKLFKQYEEQIVTLPSGYKINTASEVKQGDEASGEEVTLDGVEIVINIEGVENRNSHWIGYRRHAHTIDGCKSLYVEPLSGTQTYLSQLTKVKDNLGLQMRLIENGLMRILVLDERVAKFLREHQKEVGPYYKSMNINVIDDKWVEAGSNEDSALDGFFTGYTNEVSAALEGYAKVPNDDESSKKLEDIKNNYFSEIDILIVHQGILDKWFTDLKSVEGMKHLLEGFKRLVKYVVVTTGRGTPENIPEEAHLLPFAVVESTLFKKYPEKLILTDTIMNVLPIGKKNDNSGGQE